MDVDHGKGWQETVTVSEDISGEEKYKLHKEKKTWKEANETCVREGGHLVSILSLEEHKEVLDLVGKRHVWIGGKKRQKSRGIGQTAQNGTSPCGSMVDLLRSRGDAPRW